jgi:hypothetical protein
MILGLLMACGSKQADDPAVWSIAPGQKVTPRSTAFVATVSRIGCSSGRQGTPLKPTIDISAATIVITFRMSPHVSGANTCQGVAGVPYHVDLGSPIGHRSLVDGGCRGGTDAESTGDCSKNGVRLRAR